MNVAANMALHWYNGLLGKLYQQPTEAAPFAGFLRHLCQCVGLQCAALAIDSTHGAHSIDSGSQFIGSACGEMVSPTVERINLALRRFGVAGECVIGSVLDLDELCARQSTAAVSYLPGCDLAAYRILLLVLHGCGERRYLLALYRPRSARVFSAAERQLLESLTAHISRSINAWVTTRQLSLENEFYARQLLGSSIGVVMLDHRGAICKSNTLAQQLLARGDGMVREGERIRLLDRPRDAKLRAGIESALATIRDGGVPVEIAMTAPRHSGAPDYELVVKTLPVGNFPALGQLPHLTLLIGSRALQADISLQSLMGLYQLTRTEAVIARILVEGKTVDEIAAEMNIARTTVRAHLRSIFFKTGVKRQAVLVSLILKSPARGPDNA